MAEPGDDRPGKPVQVFFAAALIAVGTLMATLCGLCGVAVFIAIVIDSFGPSPDSMGMVVVPLLLGGLPAIAGGVMVMFGLRLWRGAKS